jgi:hypothetical protein
MLPAKWKPGRHIDQQTHSSGNISHVIPLKKSGEISRKIPMTKRGILRKNQVTRVRCVNDEILLPVANKNGSTKAFKQVLPRKEKKHLETGKRAAYLGERGGAWCFFYTNLGPWWSPNKLWWSKPFVNTWVLQTVTKIPHNRICSLSLPWLLWLTPWTN